MEDIIHMIVKVEFFILYILPGKSWTNYIQKLNIYATLLQ